MSFLERTPKDSDESEWISISDLMAGLMIIFVFIAIVFVGNTNKEKEQIERDLAKTQQNLIAITNQKTEAEIIWQQIAIVLEETKQDKRSAKDIWQKAQQQLSETIRDKQRLQEIALEWYRAQDRLYWRLREEFAEDMQNWDAILDRETLSVRFQEPTVLFAVGKAELKPRFLKILDSFFPRYLNILQEFQGDLVEVRIEGHTSSSWVNSKDDMEAYFNNMLLSQGRTLSVLRYCLGLISDPLRRNWAKSLITANGLSSSQIIRFENNQEDATRSRRVEFRVRTNAEQHIASMLQKVAE